MTLRHLRIPRFPSRARCACVLLVFAVLLGTLSAVGTGWALVNFLPVNTLANPREFQTPDGWRWIEQRTGPPVWIWYAIDHSDRPGTGSIPSWVTVPSSAHADAQTIASGWPFPCVTMSGQAGFADSQPVYRGGWLIESPAGSVDWILPLRPCGWSFVASVAVHSILPFALLFGIPSLRARMRRRRGLCLRCNYDLQGLSPGTPCPECGPAPSPRSASQN